MESQIIKIIKQVEDKNPGHESTKFITQAFNFLKNNIPTEYLQVKTDLINEALKSAQNYSLRPILPELLTVLILESFICHQPNSLKTIKEFFPEHIYLLGKAYFLSYQYLQNKNFHQLNLFSHTINTTLILAESKIHYKTIIASLLQHIPANAGYSLENIRQDFDDEVVQIIENVNRLKDIKLTKNIQDTNLLRQMFLAMAKDLRPILLKMSAHINLLKNIEQINPEAQNSLAIEAMEIYAPIADILGAWRLKWQIEDYAFKFLNPHQYSQIAKKFNVDEKKNREKYIEKTIQLVRKATQNSNINFTINGRFKHFYSIHKKMLEKKKTFNEVYDVFALRIIVDSVEDCYRMLGLLHSIWPPKPRRIKDYIARPKVNHYQGLHTTVFGINKRMTEFQIRTKDMDETAKFGVAAHWAYKNNFQKTPDWIKVLLEEKTKAQDQEDFMEKINTELLIDKIFVYTPKGDIISLPKNSTPIDFAYSIHSNLGRRASAALVNEKLESLNFKLQNEDIVEIIIDPEQKYPNPNWLDFAVSSTAKKNIKNQLNSLSLLE